ncbi:MAG: copper-binding protein [Gemmatimonas sp.]
MVMRIAGVLSVLIVLAAALAPALAHDDDESTAFGEPGLASMATRTIVVRMGDDMTFSPSDIIVREGDTIRFIVRNPGAIRHEMVLGTAEDLQVHAKLMEQFPEMQHEEAHAITVEPGKEGELAWKFTVPGDFEFACLVPGHFQAGMKGRITVEPAPGRTQIGRAVDLPSRTAPSVEHGQSEGDVRRVDLANGKITIRHGPLVGIKDDEGNDMPAMTMVFAVKDRPALTALKPGDHVRFTVVRDAGGLAIQSIDRAPTDPRRSAPN